MRNRIFFSGLILALALEFFALFLLAGLQMDNTQDTVAVNELLHTVQRDWDSLDGHVNGTGVDYVVLDAAGTVLYRARPGLSESVNAAVAHRDTILEVRVNGAPAGPLIVDNDTARTLQEERRAVVLLAGLAMLAQLAACVGYFCYMRRTVVLPFRRLERFARRVAAGNLDIPLEMERHNLFGAFTESFDLMRCELKRARLAEAKAAAEKKELIAKLSHDIKTPVASIKAASEVGEALSPEGRHRENYRQIIQKADQISTLVSNLFSAALEELDQLSVTPEDMKSGELRILLENADYLRRAELPEIPGCLLFADRLRLQEVFDNLFANSYKYAGTSIGVTVEMGDAYLTVRIEDFGGGVDERELPRLKEKFMRGGNAGGVEGAGLGLYIADHCMREMGGRLVVENGDSGLRAVVWIALSAGI